MSNLLNQTILSLFLKIFKANQILIKQLLLTTFPFSIFFFLFILLLKKQKKGTGLTKAGLVTDTDPFIFPTRLFFFFLFNIIFTVLYRIAKYKGNKELSSPLIGDYDDKYGKMKYDYPI